jgi:minor extracellular protease Epr
MLVFHQIEKEIEPLKKISFLFPVLAMTVLFFPFHGGSAAHAQSPKKTQDVIVVYKNQTGKQTVLNKSQKVEYQFKSIKALTVKVDSKSISTLEHNPNIAYVEKNVTVKSLSVADKNASFHVLTAGSQPSDELSQWNLKAVNAPEAWSEGYTGQGIKVAVIDTGIGPHTDLHVTGGFSAVDYTTSYADDYGHGTHVAGIIAAQQNNAGMAGVAPGVSLYAVKAMDGQGEGDLQDLLKAIDWSIKNRMNIINLSLGTPDNSPMLKDMIDTAYKDGILVVAAAGNDGNSDGTGDTIDYPAKYTSVIGVTAVDKNMTLGYFSSTGPEAEVAAPGVDIYSTYLDNKYAIESGTSQAAPHVTGMLALLKQAYPTLNNVQLRTMLDDFYTKDLGAFGKDPFYGYGLATFMAKSDLTSEEASKAEAAVTKAEQVKTQANLDEAVRLVNLLPDGSTEKGQLQTRLNQINSLMPQLTNARAKVALANAHHKKVDISNAQQAVQALPNLPEKTALQQQINSDIAWNLANGKAKVSLAEKNKTRASINLAKSAVSQIQDPNAQKALTNRLNHLESVLVSIATKDVKGAEQTNNKKDVDAAIRATNQLKSGATKTQLQNRIKKVEAKQVLRAKLDILNAQKVHTKRSYAIAQRAVDNLQNNSTKQYFQSWLKGLQA